MKKKIKFYIPDGHLEKKTLELFGRAGFKVKIPERAYNPEIDDEEIEMKRIRPQDFPFAVGMGKGDLAITGSDILKEYRLENPESGDNIEEIMDLKFGATSLVAATSKEVYPEIEDIEDFVEMAKEKQENSQQIVVATEYPNIARDYLEEKGVDAIIRQPAGKTEAWVIPPNPEADLIIETTETGRTLRENNCKIVDSVLEKTSSRLIANKESLETEGKKEKIDEIIQLFTGAMRGKGKVNVYMNILDPDDLDPVLEVISEYVESPTINDLRGGGYDVFIVIDEMDLKYILPKLKARGASSLAISDTRIIID